MIEEMPKKKSLFKNIKKPTIYITVVALLLVLGISYGLVYFIHNEELFSGNLTSAYLNINVSSNGSITLNNAVPLSDNAGLSSENFEVLNITNTSNMPITLKLNLESDDSSTIDISNIRYVSVATFIQIIMFRANSMRANSPVPGFLLANRWAKNMK